MKGAVVDSRPGQHWEGPPETVVLPSSGMQADGHVPVSEQTSPVEQQPRKVMPSTLGAHPKPVGMQPTAQDGLGGGGLGGGGDGGDVQWPKMPEKNELCRVEA